MYHFLWSFWLELFDFPVQFPSSSRPIPSPILSYYADWNQCDDQVLEVAQNANVIYWFAINILSKPSGPIVSGGPDLDCVAQIKQQTPGVIHLISIGGWNAPHLTQQYNASSLYSAWKQWNNGLFDGLDWDLEGNDDPTSPFNSFSTGQLDLVGAISQLAKADGFIVSMAPAESYLDVSTSAFDMHLNHTYPEWPHFAYHGRNCYAYLLVKYGQCFDWITLQLYEGYSHLLYNTTVISQDPAEYLENLVLRMQSGWEVFFQDGPRVISVHPNKLVLGLANQWADNSKFAFIQVSDLERALTHLMRRGIVIKGIAIWSIKEESRGPLASLLSNMLKSLYS